jgi:VWFA-related protein
MTRSLLTIALCAAAAFPGIAAAQDSPVIRVNTRLVEVDVVVRNKDGVVPGLTKQDFTLLDKGKPQEIALFTFKAKDAARTATVPPPPGVVSNRVMERAGEQAAERTAEAPVGATVILVDRLNTAFEFQPYLKQQMLDVLGTMQAGSPVALYTLGRDLSVVHDFTEDPGQLIRAAAILKDKTPLKNQTGQNPADLRAARLLNISLDEVLNLEQVDRSLTTTQALERIAKHLSGVHGRKSLVWLSGSFPLVYPRILRGSPDGERIEDATHASNAGNMAIYPVDVKGLSAAIRFSRRASGPIGPPGVDIMLALARDTGGRAFYNSNDIAGAIQQAMDDAEVTYTLGFYPSSSSLDGRFHPIQVKVAKVDLAKGAEVRYREGYVAEEASTPQRSERFSGLSLDDLFDDALDANAVGLTAMAHPVPGKPGTFAINVSVSVADLHLEFTKDRWTGSFDLALQMPNSNPPKGKVHRFEIHATQDDLRELLSKGYLHQELIDVGPGGAEDETVRVVVQDRITGAAGSVRVPLAH